MSNCTGGAVGNDNFALIVAPSAAAEPRVPWMPASFGANGVMTDCTGGAAVVRVSSLGVRSLHANTNVAPKTTPSAASPASRMVTRLQPRDSQVVAIDLLLNSAAAPSAADDQRPSAEAGTKPEQEQPGELSA